MGDFFRRVFAKWQWVLYLTFITAAVFFSLSALKTPKFQVQGVYLVVQKNAGAPPTSESIKYYTMVFSDVVYTENFLSDVLSSPAGVEKVFPSDHEERIQMWEELVLVDSEPESGVMRVSVVDPSKSEAAKIIGAITWNFSNNAKKYYGRENEVEIRLIDGPVVYSAPVAPNLLKDTLIGVLVGLVASSIVVYLFDKSGIVLFKPRKKEEDSKQPQESQVKKQLDRELSFAKKKGSLVYAPEKRNLMAELFKPEKKEMKEVKGEKEEKDVKEEKVVKEEKGEEKKDPEVKFVPAKPAPEKKAPAPENLPVFKAEDLDAFNLPIEDSEMKAPKVKEDEKKEAPKEEESKKVNDEKSASAKSYGEIKQDFLDISELEGKTASSADKSAFVETTADRQEQREPTEEEVKRRLNKLLKGEL